MSKNVGSIDRVLRVIIGLALLAFTLQYAGGSNISRTDRSRFLN